MSQEQLSLLDTLSPLNIEARYPIHKSRLLESLTVERSERICVCGTKGGKGQYHIYAVETHPYRE